jgi:hypothetical protein
MNTWVSTHVTNVMPEYTLSVLCRIKELFNRAYVTHGTENEFLQGFV